MIEEPDDKKNEPSRDNSLPTNGAVSPVFETPLEPLIPAQSTLQAPGTALPARSRQPRVKHHNLLGEASVAFYIGDLDDPLIAPVADRITLGRYGPYSSQPSLDLAPYSAFELGVSRLHAAIYRQDGALMFEDMNSSNGSYINAERIAPRTPHRLRSGDVIVLSRLTLEIYFKTVEIPAVPSTPNATIQDKRTPPQTNVTDTANPATIPPLPEKVTDAAAAKLDGLQKPEEPRLLQAIQGTIQFSAPQKDEATLIGAELVMYIKKSAGVDSRQTLEISISANINPSELQISELLARLLKSADFNLTLK